MNPLNILRYQLQSLQFEEYEIIRYLKLLFRKGFFPSKGSLENGLVWTSKMILVFIIALLFEILILILLFKITIYISILWLILFFFSWPFLISLSLLIIWPIDTIYKNLIINKARKILKKEPNIKIVAIAGSYGKTTMKNIVVTVIGPKLKVIATPESVNTPVGISRWLITLLQKEQKPDVLIVEMGEHYRNDIKFLCSITPPDISILTGINEAHFDRLKDIKETIATMFEVVDYAKKDAQIILNADDKHIKSNYKKYINDKKTFFYSAKNNPLCPIKIIGREFDPEKFNWSFIIEGLGQIIIPFLGEYAIGDVIAAKITAESLGFNNEEIKKGIDQLKPVPRRLELINGQNDILVIDDSYNGNPDGVAEAIKTLSQFSQRRKIFITPGLVEMGDKAKEIHQKIGNNLAKVANKVILIKTQVSPYIAEGLKENGFQDKDIIWFNSSKEAHQSLTKILRSGDVILFQNDWSDQYI